MSTVETWTLRRSMEVEGSVSDVIVVFSIVFGLPAMGIGALVHVMRKSRASFGNTPYRNSSVYSHDTLYWKG